MKTCTKCKKRKPLEEFAKKRSAPDGLQWWCRSCAHDAYMADIERNRAARRRRYATNRDEIIAQYRESRRAHLASEVS